MPRHKACSEPTALWLHVAAIAAQFDFVVESAAAPHEVQERLKANLRLTGKDVRVLDMLALSLRKDLWFGIQMPRLAQHPLFPVLGSRDSSLLRDICWHAIGSHFLQAKTSSSVHWGWRPVPVC